MATYIDKDALVAELERLYDLEYYNRSDLSCGKKMMLRHILLFLNALEVKEVDFEKEISNYLNNHNLNIKDGGRIVFGNGDTPNFWCDFRDIAKHFFELGIGKLLGLEKQGEQEPQVYETGDGEIITYSETEGYKVVEPKFKIGNWITNGEYTWKVTGIKPLDYILESQDGIIVVDTISYVDEHFHHKRANLD